jgi:acyl carrier protein
MMSHEPVGATEAQIVDRTRAYLRENFLYARADWKLRDDDSLIDTGVIDSIGVVELIAFLQEAFGVAIAEDEITEPNLGSLTAIGRFVHAKCHAGTAGGQACSPHRG